MGRLSDVLLGTHDERHDSKYRRRHDKRRGLAEASTTIDPLAMNRDRLPQSSSQKDAGAIAVGIIEQRGWWLERQPTWLAPATLALARSTDLHKYQAQNDPVEPGAFRLLGAYARAPELRPLVRSAISAPVSRRWFRARPQIHFTLLRAPEPGRGA